MKKNIFFSVLIALIVSYSSYGFSSFDKEIVEKTQIYYAYSSPSNLDWKKFTDFSLENTFIKSKSEINGINNDEDLLELLGLEVEKIDTSVAKKIRIRGGVRVEHLEPGLIKQHTDMKEGFIITHVGQYPIATKDELIKLLKQTERRVWLTGKYEDSPRPYFYPLEL